VDDGAVVTSLRLLSPSRLLFYPRTQAGNPGAVMDFLQVILQGTELLYEKELELLRKEKASDGLDEPLATWDFSFYKRRLYDRRSPIDAAALQEFFPMVVWGVWSGETYVVCTRPPHVAPYAPSRQSYFLLNVRVATAAALSSSGPRD